MTTTNAIIYRVVASEAGGQDTEWDALYGDATILHTTREAAEDEADRLEGDAVWGHEGDKFPSDVGISYHVEETTLARDDSTWEEEAGVVA